MLAGVGSSRKSTLQAHRDQERGGTIHSLHTDSYNRIVTTSTSQLRKHCTTGKPVSQLYLSASLLLVLLRNIHVPHIRQLRSSRNRIKLIDKSLTSIYSRILSQRSAHSSPANQHTHFVLSQPHPPIQSINEYTYRLMGPTQGIWNNEDVIFACFYRQLSRYQYVSSFGVNHCYSGGWISSTRQPHTLNQAVNSHYFIPYAFVRDIILYT